MRSFLASGDDDVSPASLAYATMKELKCKAYSVVTKRYGDSNANKNIVNKAGSEDVETYVRRITTTVCGNRIICPTCKNGGGGGPSGIGGGMLDDLLKHKKLCEVATHRYNVQTTKCNLLDKKWHDKRKSCNSLQDTMDASSCKWAIDTKDACESYAECYKATVQAYEDAKCRCGMVPSLQGQRRRVGVHRRDGLF